MELVSLARHKVIIMTDNSLVNFYYGAQIKRYIIEFMAIFSGLKVSIGKNDNNSQTNLIEVPITYGSKDRVVAAILAENTQNKMIRVPTMATNISEFNMAPELMKGQGQKQKKVRLPLGETLPDGLKTVELMVPIPYTMKMNLAIIASNTDQNLQILEQIMQLFNPVLQIQTSDEYMDWTKITTVTMEAIVLPEEYPAGNTKRLITSEFTFSLPIYLSPPANIRTDFIKRFKLGIQIFTSDVNLAQQLDESIREVGSIDRDVILDADTLDIPKN